VGWRRRRGITQVPTAKWPDTPRIWTFTCVHITQPAYNFHEL
jgi:hypothetical protein